MGISSEVTPIQDLFAWYNSKTHVYVIDITFVRSKN